MITSVITVNESNLDHYPQSICFINQKHPAFPLKVEWLKERFTEGLVIKLLYVEGEKRPVGFIEYVPGDQCWRGVTAPGYLFIHCIWVNAVKYKNKGFGSRLIGECLADAREGGYHGVAALTSSGTFMASRSLFLKNRFQLCQTEGVHDLLIHPLKEGPEPYFNNYRAELEKLNGLHMIYSRQCPWVARFVSEVVSSLRQKGIEITVTELKTPQQAQHAPSLYSVFNLVNNGKLLADHYISETRLMNILKKEKLVYTSAV